MPLPKDFKIKKNWPLCQINLHFRYTIKNWTVKKTTTTTKVEQWIYTHFLNQLLTMSDEGLHKQTVMCQNEDSCNYFT